MIELPDLLLSHGINLKQVGNEFSCLCYAHDDHNPSMSVYRNGDGGWRAHCHSCGHHSDVIAAYCYLNDLDTKNPQHFLQAKSALEDGNIYTGKPFATIENDAPLPKRRPERTMLIPTADTKPPKMGWLQGKDGASWGEPSEVFIFKQSDGTPWMFEARWNLINKQTGEYEKECRVFSYGRRGSQPPKWECAHHLAPRPLFGLDVLATKPTAQVIICEGARKAQAAQTLVPMLPCIGWAGGAQSWSKSDWSPIENRGVILWPDADEPGRTCMAEIAQQLIAQGCTCYILDTLDKPDAWDAVDAIKEGWDPQRTLAWAKENKGDAVKAVEKKTPEKTVEHEPLLFENHSEEDEPPNVNAFDTPNLDNPSPHVVDIPPIHFYNDGTIDHVFPKDPADLFSEYVVPELQRGILPKVIEDHVFDIAEVINTDPAFGALTAVATVAGLIDDRIKIYLNQGYRESARLWTVCVGEPSTKKSPIMDAVRSPLDAIKKRYASEEKKIIQRQGILDARYQAKLKEYTKACIESDNHDMQEPTPCEQLQRRRIECDNLTREAFEEVLRNMPTGLIIHADELAGFIGSMDAYKAAGAKADRALWLRAYNGGSMQVDKVQRGSYLIENWSATISGGIQPSKLASMAGQLDDDGLLQRFLIVCSSRDGGQGLARTPNMDASNAWANLLEYIVELKHMGGYVQLTKDAAEIRNEAVAYIYRIINSRTIGRAFTTALGKWEGTTARMMLIFHVVDCASNNRHPESVNVSGKTAQLAVDYMMRHLLPHMVSFYEDGLCKSETKECAKLLAGRIVADGMGEIKTTWLHQYGPGKWRSGTPEFQNQTLNRLVEYGWLSPVGGMNNATKRPTKYLVNPHVHELFQKHKELESQRIENARELGRKIRDGEFKRSE